MMEKTPVSILEEFCAKYKGSKPIYNFTQLRDEKIINFTCTLEIDGKKYEGKGKSKKEAKHNTAEIAMKEFETKLTQETNENSSQISHCYAISDLNFICMENNYPHPKFKMIEDQEKFIVECSVGTIKCCGNGTTRLEAKQEAAFQLIKVIQNVDDDKNKELVNKYLQFEDEYKKRVLEKFEAYKEFVPYGIISTKTDLNIFNRHNYFKNYDRDSKTKAFDIIQSSSHVSAKEKVDKLLEALNIKYKKSYIPSIRGHLIFIELTQIEISVCFAQKDNRIYDEIIEYFTEMLY